MNSYFQFKKFRIEQDRCAMKVSTDACIQGAWTPILPGVKRVLDIGTGTGLLSLMLAQKSNKIKIDAIEIDPAAVVQAGGNFLASPWSERLNAIYSNIKEYDTSEQYDMIICNPPFFQNSLHSNDAARNVARHTTSLNYTDIIMAMEKNLNEDGYASILLPAAEYEIWEKLLLTTKWNILGQLNIQPLPFKPVNRIVSICSRHRQEKQTENLIIYAEPQQYTTAFNTLLQPYYLNL